MKLTQLFKSFQIFGLIIHLILVTSLISIGFFDFLGLKPLLNSVAELLSSLTVNQSSLGTGGQLSNQIIVKMIELFPVLLSTIKSLSILATLSFLAHLFSFYNSWKKLT
jgi:hypothetical protein